MANSTNVLSIGRAVTVDVEPGDDVPARCGEDRVGRQRPPGGNGEPPFACRRPTEPRHRLRAGFAASPLGTRQGWGASGSVTATTPSAASASGAQHLRDTTTILGATATLGAIGAAPGRRHLGDSVMGTILSPLVRATTIAKELDRDIARSPHGCRIAQSIQCANWHATGLRCGLCNGTCVRLTPRCGPCGCHPAIGNRKVGAALCGRSPVLRRLGGRPACLRRRALTCARKGR